MPFCFYMFIFFFDSKEKTNQKKKLPKRALT